MRLVVLLIALAGCGGSVDMPDLGRDLAPPPCVGGLDGSLPACCSVDYSCGMSENSMPSPICTAGPSLLIAYKSCFACGDCRNH